MDFTIFNKVIDGIVKLIVSAREHIPSDIYMIVAGAIGLVGSYYWIKQWVSSGWMKVSTIINLILMALLIFILLTKVG